MTTIMTWGNSEGVKGRCDSKCHDAAEPECDCMCGGAFHGRANTPGGLAQAVAESWRVVFDAAQAEAAVQRLDIFGTPGAVMQMDLL